MDSIDLPWFQNLDEEDRVTFQRELLETFAACLSLEDWRRFDELLEDWQATAEASRQPEILEAWRTRGNPADYVAMESPRGAARANAV